MPTQDHHRGPAIRRLVGVYNADGSVGGELRYLVGARLGRAHCALCDITHGLVRERAEWKACRAKLPVPFDTYHRDDQPDAVRTANGGRLPIVLAETEAGFFGLLGPEELDACAASVARLSDAIDRAVSDAGLRWPSTVTIRAARAEDGSALRDIEWQAGERFRSVGLGFVADHEPASIDELAEYSRAGRSWVAVGVDDSPVGYVVVDVIDGNAHVEQVSVRPDRQGEGIGRALMDRVQMWAIETARPAITLTTFADVPWNRPLYEHLGYRVLADHEIGPELRALRAKEADEGLDPATRVCMRVDIGSGSAV